MTGPEKAAALLARKHAGPPVTMLTAYDYPTARLFDDAGIDALLVGDSLGMVVLGYPDTTHVTLEHMLHHVAAVARAKPKALVVGDFSIGTYPDAATAVANARKLVAAGAEAVKLEGGVAQADKVRAIVEAGIPVCGHLGMLPQSVLEEGGYKKKGKTPEQSTALLEDARALAEAGVFAIVLESVVPKTAEWVSSQISVPTIGIGSGEHTCDGEVAVATDLIGTFPWFVPPFAKPEADLAPQIIAAAAAYKVRVQHTPALGQS
ncbi:3-methyl-2-oxobutanoate hydroxymethyltransferase [Luteolibacter flavescens]|uniref:3-methyl-2-oxobutanoate hydroxymethyltransferase n=1 Tax=Luteolibacter flavescens TaxID=1859460 RepID=A0ABT3FQC6_9BACT|nr:3-methyl-2-oxobutanoate hydroxymethyltransferase [Luteolibacter flavescens]MCW1885796.1 3-methyl-2-oxobutanoate hydroxymethyltransferase [Luteolibacter flavescens]